jgi:hypothetical protein
MLKASLFAALEKRRRELPCGEQPASLFGKRQGLFQEPPETSTKAATGGFQYFGVFIQPKFRGINRFA